MNTKYLFFALLTLSLASCDVLKPAGGTNIGKKPNNGGGTPNTTRMDTVRWGESNGKPIQNSNTGKNNGNNNPTPTRPYEQPNTIPTYPSSPTETNVKSEKKSTYKVAIILPFFTDKYSDASTSNYSKSAFAIDFYAGVKVALDSLQQEYDGNFDITILDSKEEFNTLLARSEVRKADFVIGPIEKENIGLAADFAKNRNVTLVSPFFPSGDMDGTNANFIQVKPSLRSHINGITANIQSKYQPDQVVLVLKTDDNAEARSQLFKDANEKLGSGNFQEVLVNSELDFNPADYVTTTRTTVFVIPSWNETFVAGVLKKLDNPTIRKNIAVYGMPQWADYKYKDIFERLKVRISSSSAVNNGDLATKYFKQKFFNKFGKMPNYDAYLGYDCMFYFAQAAKQYGNKFATYLDGKPQQMLLSKFEFEKVYSQKGDDFGKIMKIENKKVNVLKYNNGAFRLE